VSGVIAAASAAFQLSSTVLQQVGGSPTEEPQQSNSIFDHWPVATAGLSCLITAVHTVAMGILGNVVLSVLMGIAALGCAALTVYLWNFSTLKHLETYVDAFAKRVTDLAQTILRLHGANKELDQTKTALEAAVKEREEQFEAQKAAAAHALARLDHVSTELKQTQGQVAEMGKILDGSHSVVSEMTSKIGSFVALNHDISASSEMLAGELPAIKAIGDRLQLSIQTLEQQSDALVEKKKRADATVKMIYNQFMEVAQLLVSLKQQRESLESTLFSLQGANVALANQTTALHSAATDLDQGATRAQQTVDKLKPLVDLAQALKKASERPPAQPK
jgi:chromosome segregation ATPase